jgi:hypothetical protein
LENDVGALADGLSHDYGFRAGLKSLPERPTVDDTKLGSDSNFRSGHGVWCGSRSPQISDQVRCTTEKLTPKKEMTMPAIALPPQRGIAPTVLPTNVAIDSIQKQPDTTKSNVMPTKSIRPSTVQDFTSEDDIWKQLEPIYSWVGI